MLALAATARSSAESSNLLWERQMLLVQTAKACTDPLRYFMRGQQSCRFDDPALAMHPFRLDRVEPRTLDRQEARHDPHPHACLLDLPIVLPDPLAHRLADMPTRIVP